MRKHLLVSSFFGIVALSLIIQTGITESPQKVKSISEVVAVEPRSDPWRLKGKDKHQVFDEIVVWANDHFNSAGNDMFGDIADVETPELPFKLVKQVEFEVVPIPEWRRALGYEEAKIPTYHVVFVLRDGRGQLYNAAVESYDNPHEFTIHSVGPALSRTEETINLPIDKRRLKTWPIENVFVRPANTKGRPVLIPYPYSMNQYFFQYGDDLSNATFVSIDSGKIYPGLETVLSEVDIAWQDVR